jgi:hypothetical protein
MRLHQKYEALVLKLKKISPSILKRIPNLDLGDQLTKEIFDEFISKTPETPSSEILALKGLEEEAFLIGGT